MALHPFIPRGSWGANLLLTPSQVRQIRASEGTQLGRVGDEWKPDIVKRLPGYPHRRPQLYPFFRPVFPNKESPTGWSPRPFMLAGSPIDERSGIYLIWNKKEKSIYVGRSVGTSRQGNLRHTLARHWQSWQRGKKLTEYVSKFKHGAPMKSADAFRGGVTYPRDSIYVCIIPIENDDPRIVTKSSGKILAPSLVEAWFFSEVCKTMKCDGTNQLARLLYDSPDQQLDEETPF